MGKGSELDKQINKEGSNTWGCPQGWLDVEDVKEFIRKLLTPNNISKGFVEVSTIRYYAGERLIWDIVIIVKRKCIPVIIAFG